MPSSGCSNASRRRAIAPTSKSARSSTGSSRSSRSTPRSRSSCSIRLPGRRCPALKTSPWRASKSTASSSGSSRSWRAWIPATSASTPRSRCSSRTFAITSTKRRATSSRRCAASSAAKRSAELGEALAEAKKSAPTHPHPRLPDDPPGVAGTIAAVVDRVGDNISGVAQGSVSALQDLIARIRGTAKPKVSPTGSTTTRKRAKGVRRAASTAIDGTQETVRSARKGAKKTTQAAASGVKSTATTAKKSARATGATGKRAASKTASAAKRAS